MAFFWYSVFSSEFLRRSNNDSNNYRMVFYNIKTAIRNLWKSRVFAAVSIAGLSLGISVSLLIFNYVWSEFSFDRMHKKGNRIFRVESRFYEGNLLTEDWATSSFGYGTAIKNEIPGVESYVRIGLNLGEQTVSYNNKRYRETGIGYTDPSFFDIFDFKLKRGLPTEQFSRPNTCVITEEAAARYFSDEDPIGKTLTFATGSHFTECEVTGIIENFPTSSHISYNFLISYKTLPDWMEEFWYIHEVYTYLLLTPGTDPAVVEAAFPSLAEKYKTMDALRSKSWGIHLVPLRDIHLNPRKQNEREMKGDKNSLVILFIIAILILVTAWINYINLTTARSVERAKEISIRKVAGAYRHQLVRQFLSEAFLINLISAITAILLIELLMPAFNMLVGADAAFVLFREPLFIVAAIVVLVLATILSGFYPAFIMTRIRPSSMLKGNYYNSAPAGTTRRILVVLQFAVSLMLICGTFIIYRQVRFMERHDKGIDISRIIVLNYPVAREDLGHKIELFAENLRNREGIESVTLSGAVPGMEVAFFASNRIQGEGEEQHRLYEMLTVDEYYLRTFDFKIVAGRSFQRDFGSERDKIVINEAVLPYIGISKPDDAIGRKILLEGESEPVSIIGVVQNWHQRGLSNPYTPIMILMNGRLGWVPPHFISVKLSGKNNDRMITLIREQWEQYFPEASFDLFFLDSFFDDQYKSDRRFGTVVASFTLFALFISLLGLWAMTAYMMSKRVKEMGIRKIMGAGTGGIILLYTREVLYHIIVAFVIATPVSCLIMRNWLLNYPFHTNIPVWVYGVSVILMVAIAFVTTGWQTWRVVKKDPVESLRYE